MAHGSFLEDQDGSALMLSEGGLYYLVTEDYVAPDNPDAGPGHMGDYDVLAAVDILFQGLVVQRPLIDAAWNRWYAKNAPLDSSDIPGILAAANVLNEATALASYVPSTEPDYPLELPDYPDHIQRFADSNPAPDGWSIETNGKVVFP